MSETDKTRLFRVIAEALAFNPTEYEQFNSDIQREIEHAPPDEALVLATIKLEEAKRLYRAVHRGA